MQTKWFLQPEFLNEIKHNKNELVLKKQLSCWQPTDTQIGTRKNLRFPRKVKEGKGLHLRIRIQTILCNGKGKKKLKDGST